MLDGGITPSPQRVKEYLEESCLGANCQPKIKGARDVLRDALRIEEGRSKKESNPEYKQLLIAVESNKSPQELTLALAKITPQPQEPNQISE